jgi:hypothetical protein
MAVKAFGIGSGIDTFAVNNMTTCKICLHSISAPAESLVAVNTSVSPYKSGSSNLTSEIIPTSTIPG